MPTRLLQLQRGNERRVALVEEPKLRLLDTPSVDVLVGVALQTGCPILELIDASKTSSWLDYDPIYNDQSDWKILPPMDHPDPAHCHVAGTGLTHLGSAKNRNSMHEKSAHETDSMKMFRWGLEGGKPPAGQVGIAPEWFYKGDGSVLRAHNQPLDIPPFGDDGGEEAEIVGIYFIDPNGNPVRIGMAQGNEFSDHVFEKRNYLNLAGSKLRTCSIGPELLINADFTSIPGEAAVLREGATLWSKPMATGEAEMSHSLANMEHHHFKFDAHRRPGDVHIHFFGTSALSYADGVRLQAGDIMQVHFPSFGRALRNPLRIMSPSANLIPIIPLT